MEWGFYITLPLIFSRVTRSVEGVPFEVNLNLISCIQRKKGEKKLELKQNKSDPIGSDVLIDD